ncbi:lipopolysaccharide biosynthesis protein [Maritalea mediterranea]|uniref:Oligosaccharide flippase family protein n=1 Tax=Maritalea mediterranea TaxID=2909667 RepID=A0ABS9E7E6_9HYPH|nr:oligosaccharide flippase family protein [Maritalea mediterranea]MCF4098713.1 oligosaccharide flippase family protein [Maritalea mediterranea]
MAITRAFSKYKSTAGFASIATLAVRLGGAGIGFLSHVVLARLVDPAQYGVYVFAWTVIVLLGTFSGIGLPVAATKFVSTYQDQQKQSLLRRFILYAGIVGLLVAFGAACAMFAVSFFAPEYIVEPIFRPALLIGAFCIPLFTLTEVGKGIARGFGRNVVAYAPAFLFRPILLLAGVGLYLIMGWTLTAVHIVYITLVALVLPLLWQWSFMRAPLRAGQENTEESPRMGRVWLFTALPLTAVEAYNLLLANTDILVLKFFTSPAELAIYFVGTKIAALLSFVTFAISASAGKPIAAAHGRGDVDKVRRLTHHFSNLAFWPTLAGFVVLLLGGTLLLSLFGSVYLAAYLPMMILAFGVLLQSYTAAAKFCLAMTGGQKQMSVVLLATVVINAGLNLVLVPTFGIVGAASATVLATILSIVALLWLIKKQMGFWAIATGIPRQLNLSEQDPN